MYITSLDMQLMGYNQILKRVLCAPPPATTKFQIKRLLWPYSTDRCSSTANLRFSVIYEHSVIYGHPTSPPKIQSYWEPSVIYGHPTSPPEISV